MSDKPKSNVVRMPIPKWVKNKQAWLVWMQMLADKRTGRKYQRRAPVPSRYMPRKKEGL